MTFEFLCAGLNFDTFNLVTFWFPGSASETSGLVLPERYFDSEPERGVWGFGGLWRRGEPEL